MSHSFWLQIEKFPSETQCKPALCHVGEARSSKSFTWIQDKTCLCWLLFLCSVSAELQGGKQACYPELQQLSTALKAWGATRMGAFSVVYLAAPDQQPLNHLRSPPLTSLLWFMLPMLHFIITLPLRVASRSTEKTIAPSIPSALERQPLKRKLSQIALHFDWNRKINTNRLSQLLAGSTNRKVIQGCFVLICPDSRRYFSSAF